ncbi:L type [Durusdinium trenchii]|uniref:L type n=1 Tax=Durusdinium trenchii TaxID=1381693 RepID=A0ABP0HCX1_9DINO
MASGAESLEPGSESAGGEAHGGGEGNAPETVEMALGVLAKSNPLRMACSSIADTKVFKNTVLVLILGNCFFLALTEPFATCCTSAQMSDPEWLKVDLTNFTVRCDMYNELVDEFEEPLNQKCCINADMLEGDPYNMCASNGLKQAQLTAELFFNTMFSIELVIKVITWGLIMGKGTYLRDPWNVLDFVVVTIGWLSYVPGIDNMSSLRTFRVLRPLRTLSSIDGMRPIVNAMLSCVRSMIHVAMLCVFLFAVFGIVGLQIFGGVLTGRCHYVDPLSYGATIDSHDFSTFLTMNDQDETPCPLPCASSIEDETSLGLFTLADWTRPGKDCLGAGGDPCGARGNLVLDNPFYTGVDGATIISHDTVLPKEMAATAESDPFGNFFVFASNGTLSQRYDPTAPAVEVTTFCVNTHENQLGSGFAHFDAIGYAWLTIFTSITLEGWVDIMYAIQASFGYDVVVFAYFFLLVWLCSFFMLELTLAVINEAYDRAAEAESDRKAEEAAGTLEKTLANHIPGTEEARVANANALERAKSRRREREGKENQPWGPPIVRKIFWLVEEYKPFGHLVTILIVLNTITLAMESHNMPESRKEFLRVTNYFFTAAFTIEMVLKVVGLGVRQYARVGFNLFDFCIVMVSLVELYYELEGSEDGGSGLGALRTFRLMRVFKLARSWKNLYHLLNTILLSVIDAANATILLVIIMFIFTLLGMQLFGGKWTGNHFCDDPNDYAACVAETPRANFDNFFWGFVTVFQVLTGENWNEVLYIGKTVSGEIAWVYFVSLNIVGNYLVLNLFLAILLARFDNPDEEEELEGRDTQLGDAGTKRQGKSATVAPMPIQDADEAETNEEPEGRRRSRQSSVIKSGGGGLVGSTTATPSPGLGKLNRAGGAASDDEEEVVIRNPNKVKMNPTAKSFFIFAPDMWLRQRAFRLIGNSKFDNFILLLIGVSTVLLALEEPWIEECSETTCKMLHSFIQTMDLILNVFFIAEMLIKMFALGVVMHPNSYLRSGWSILDFVIVNVSILSMSLGGQGALKALRSLRSLRALRPLRVISRSPGMRLVVNSLIAAIPAIANVTVVVILFMLIFAILGVQNFAGGLNSCNDPNVPGPTKLDCVGYSTAQAPEGHDQLYWHPVGDACGVLPTEDLILECLRNGTGGCQTCLNGTGFPRIWGPGGGRANSYNYDNVGQALLIVFEVVSGEMWPDIMYDTMDISGPDMPMREWPHREHQSVAWWFISVTLVCSFLMINVFVGVIIDNFNHMKEEENGSGLLTDEQKLWIETMKRTMQQKPIKLKRPPSGHFRRWTWDIVDSTKFEVTIMGFILLNTFTMMLESQEMSETKTTVLNSLNVVFLVVFTVEAAVKLFALRREYFNSGWNCFDFSLVIFGYLGLVGGLGPIASLLRIFRVARIFRLVKTSPGLLTIFRTLVFSIPSILNVAGIFLLLVLIFAILGMNLFANIKHGELLNEDANFSGFFISMTTLFRVATGESFNGIMHDCMIQEPYCDPEVNCGYPQFAPIYFCSFFLLSSYTLLSLITAIVLDEFADQGAQVTNVVTEEHIDEFKMEWSKLDPSGTMLINEDLLVKLVSRVPYPLGVDKTPKEVSKGKSRRKLANALIRKLDVPSIRGKVAFNDVLTELTTKAMPDIEIPEDNAMIAQIKGKKDSHQNKMIRRMGTSRENILYSAAQVNGIMIIQSAMRGMIYRAKLEEMMHEDGEARQPLLQEDAQQDDVASDTQKSSEPLDIAASPSGEPAPSESGGANEESGSQGSRAQDSSDPRAQATLEAETSATQPTAGESGGDEEELMVPEAVAEKQTEELQD